VRLFVAVEVGEAVRAAAAGLIVALRARIDRVEGAKLSWVAPERMHLTVRFIGEMDDDHAARLASVLAPPLPVAPFQIVWNGVGAFPNVRRPRVIVCDIGRGQDGMAELEQEVSARLESAGVPREARPYTPHLTLARVRESRRLAGASAFEGADRHTLGTTAVDAITLFQSQLSSRGPTYVALQRTSLVGRTED
jgi:2'-5' RNA ligase